MVQKWNQYVADLLLLRWRPIVCTDVRDAVLIEFVYTLL